MYLQIEEQLQHMIYTKFLGYVPEGEEAELITNIDDSCLYYEFLHFMDEKMYSVEPVMVSTPSYEFQPMADVEKEFLSLFEELKTRKSGKRNQEMNKKEVLELKRRFKKEAATFTRVCGCYVDGNHNKVCKFGNTFLNLEEDEFYKYLEIANKALSGTIGNNLLELKFPIEEEEVGGRQHILMALRASKLEDENLLDTFYDLVIDTYDHAGNYLIVLFHDAYDVMSRTSDNNNLDESEEVYEYLICAICPVDLSKPGLGFLEDEHRIEAACARLGGRSRGHCIFIPGIQ